MNQKPGPTARTGMLFKRQNYPEKGDSANAFLNITLSPSSLQLDINHANCPHFRAIFIYN